MRLSDHLFFYCSAFSPAAPSPFFPGGRRIVKLEYDHTKSGHIIFKNSNGISTYISASLLYLFDFFEQRWFYRRTSHFIFRGDFNRFCVYGSFICQDRKWLDRLWSLGKCISVVDGKWMEGCRLRHDPGSYCFDLILFHVLLFYGRCR